MRNKRSIKAFIRAVLFVLFAGTIPPGFCQSHSTQLSDSTTTERAETPVDPLGHPSLVKVNKYILSDPKIGESIRGWVGSSTVSEWSRLESWDMEMPYDFVWKQLDNQRSAGRSLLQSPLRSNQIEAINIVLPNVFADQLELDSLEFEPIAELDLNSDIDTLSESIETDRKRNFGGPDAVPNRLETDQLQQDMLFELKALRPYYEWKNRLAEQTGFSYALDYYNTILKANKSIAGTSDSASSGVFRLTGSWQFLGRGTESVSTLNFLVEQRHKFSQNTPAGFAFESLGYLGAIDIPFADDGWHLTNLYLSQSWLGGDAEAVLGFLDVTDFVDVYPLTSPWTDFSNFVFSIGVATMDLPDDAALGFGAGVWLSDNLYILAGLFDLNSDPNNPFNGFNTFFDQRRFFKAAELGYTWAAKERYYFDNVHLTVWHADQRESSGVLTDGWGMVFSYSDQIDDHWLIFARAGYSEDGGGLLQKAVSLGFGYQPNPIGAVPGSQLGFGINWGQPNSSLFGSGLKDQYAIESYYRLQVTGELAITPMVQLLLNPALNPQQDTILVFGLRTRLSF